MTAMFKIRFLSTLTIFLTLSATALMADTLELVDGSLVEGRYIGGNSSSIMFEAAGEVTAHETSEIVALYLSDGVAAAEAISAAPAAQVITVPQGTRLLIRTSEALDSKRHPAGHRFRGQLEGALVVQGQEVAPRGSTVYGQITQAKQSGRVAGSSELAIEFTDLMIGDRLFPITTSGLKAQTGGTGKQTVGRTARAAAVGGLIGGSSGARTGAKVGVGASILTSGKSINIPAGTLVEASLSTPLTLQ
jgi:hypothetical protein